MYVPHIFHGCCSSLYFSIHGRWLARLVFETHLPLKTYLIIKIKVEVKVKINVFVNSDLTSERCFSYEPGCVLFVNGTTGKLNEVTILIELKVRLKEDAIFDTEIQAQCSGQITSSMNRSRDISLGTETTKAVEVIRRNIEMEVISQLKTWLAGFRRLCPEETGCLACRSSELAVEFRKVQVEAWEVDIWEERRIVGKDKLIASGNMLAQAQSIFQRNKTHTWLSRLTDQWPLHG